MSPVGGKPEQQKRAQNGNVKIHPDLKQPNLPFFLLFLLSHISCKFIIMSKSSVNSLRGLIMFFGASLSLIGSVCILGLVEFSIQLFRIGSASLGAYIDVDGHHEVKAKRIMNLFADSGMGPEFWLGFRCDYLPYFSRRLL